jgi:AraC-like DNA-binding protein
MSERSFLRRFAEETGTTPLQWLVSARLGLGSAANLRLHFRRALNTTPTAYRRAFTR